MTRLVKRAWIPLVMVIVVAVAAFTVSRLHGIFGSNMYRPDVGNADAIVQFNPKRVLYEIFGPAGTVADKGPVEGMGPDLAPAILAMSVAPRCALDESGAVAPPSFWPDVWRFAKKSRVAFIGA